MSLSPKKHMCFLLASVGAWDSPLFGKSFDSALFGASCLVTPSILSLCVFLSEVSEKERVREKERETGVVEVWEVG